MESRRVSVIYLSRRLQEDYLLIGTVLFISASLTTAQILQIIRTYL